MVDQTKPDKEEDTGEGHSQGANPLARNDNMLVVAVPVPGSYFHAAKPVPHSRNIVVIGESGAGKSSIANMLAGKDVFSVDTGAAGTHFQHESCAIEFDGGRVVNVFDTTGLGHPERRKAAAGAVVSQATLQAMLSLLRDIGQVSLLVFVTRFRITKETVDNYHLFRAVLGEAVPVVVAITGREFEVDNEGWWRKNRDNFAAYGMTFDGHAIGTAKRRFSFDPAYVELRDGLRRLISSRCCEGDDGDYNPVNFDLDGPDFDCTFEKVSQRLKEASTAGSSPVSESQKYVFARSQTGGARPRPFTMRFFKALSCLW